MSRVDEVRGLVQEAGEDHELLRSAWGRAKEAKKEARAELERLEYERRRILVEGTDAELEAHRERQAAVAQEIEDLGQLEAGLRVRWEKRKAETLAGEAKEVIQGLPDLMDAVEETRERTRVAEAALGTALRKMKDGLYACRTVRREGEFPELPFDVADRLRRLRRREGRREEDLGLPVASRPRLVPPPDESQRDSVVGWGKVEGIR